jgi:hypothetical protein
VGVGDCKRNVEKLGERLRKQRLPVPVGRAAECCFGHSTSGLIYIFFLVRNALVVVINRDRQNALCALLSDDVWTGKFLFPWAWGVEARFNLGTVFPRLLSRCKGRRSRRNIALGPAISFFTSL